MLTQCEYVASSDDFTSLMRYFNDPSEAEKTCNPLVSDIDQAVKTARSNEEWRHDLIAEMVGVSVEVVKEIQAAMSTVK